ncbi:MAG: polysaccharide deacetylase family protein, partial [Actinomycetes bacterium]
EHRDTEDVERRVLKAAKPGDIVLMHDIHRTTVKAVPKIIDRLAAEGYVFVTVSELFGGRLEPGKEYVRLNSGEPQGHP